MNELILFIGFDILELRRQGGILSGLAETLPANTFSGGFSVDCIFKDFKISLSFSLPLSLTVKPAGALCSTEGELGGAEVGVATLTVIGVLQTLAPGPPDGVARGGAESLPEVAAGGKKLPQIAQAANRI